jgi:hypothetical protein
MSRVEMLHQDKSYARGWRQSVKELDAGIETTGRSADADDRKIFGSSY